MKLNIQTFTILVLLLTIFSYIHLSQDSLLFYNENTGEIVNKRGQCQRNCMRGRFRKPTFSNPFKNFKMPNFKNLFGNLFSFCAGGSTSGTLCTLIGGKLFGIDFAPFIMMGIIIIVIYFVVLK